jgi:DNA mismatch repair protein PMS2
MEEVIILEHLPTFKQNGFSFLVDPEAGPMQRVKLLSLPYSKGVQFGLEDIHELASLLGDSSFGFGGTTEEGGGGGGGGGGEEGEEGGKEGGGRGGPSVRLPKIRAMFASRACRMSIMIGKALTKPQVRRREGGREGRIERGKEADKSRV